MATSLSTPRGGFENQLHFGIFETQSDCLFFLIFNFEEFPQTVSLSSKKFQDVIFETHRYRYIDIKFARYIGRINISPEIVDMASDRLVVLIHVDM